MDDAVRFVSERLLADGPDMVPAYTTVGGPVPDQRRLGLPGYPGGTDVVGNWVNQQFQLDAFGESLLLFAAAAGHDHLDADGWRAAETAVAAIEQRWREPDAGIWELEPDNWTHSRLICAAGLRAIAAHQRTEQGARWLALADAIVAETAATAVHPTGRWQRSPTDDRVDAALLLPAIRGAVAGRRSADAGHAAGRRGRADRGRLLLPLPARRAAAGRGRGRVRALRLPAALAWPSRATRCAPSAGSSATAPPAGPPGCCPRSSMSCSVRCGATCPRRSCTPLLLECAVTLTGAGEQSSTPSP